MATLKHKIAFKEVVNGSTLTQAMKVAKYSNETVKRTNKLTRTKGWEELMNTYINDLDLAKRHNEQLNSSKLTKLYFDIDDEDSVIEDVCKKLGVELLYIKVNKDKSGKTVNVKAPDFFFRDLALDKAYKVKGRYSEVEHETNKTLIINITGETAERYGLITSSNTEDNSPRQA